MATLNKFGRLPIGMAGPVPVYPSALFQTWIDSLLTRTGGVTTPDLTSNEYDTTVGPPVPEPGIASGGPLFTASAHASGGPLWTAAAHASGEPVSAGSNACDFGPVDIVNETICGDPI